MRIDSITNILNNNYFINRNKQNQTKIPENNKYTTDVFKNFPIPFLGAPRVRKDMARFFNVNEEKIPTTVKLYLESLPDMFTMNPVQAHKNAYANLAKANNIQEVQELFADEELFICLKPLENTKATKGLLSIYREFKELFKDGILSNGDDFVVYLLRKLFMEAKSITETNLDLDKDLIPDIKDLFYSRHEHNEYLQSSTLKGLGIYLPDPDYLTSLRYTRDGYSDYIGLKISKALQENWNKYTKSEQEEIIRTRCKGRDEWWNNLPYERKLELAAGVESEDELYKDYKNYVKEKHLIPKKEEQNVPEYEKVAPKKKIKVGSNIKDKDLFILWMKGNLEKYYASLSKEELERINIKRSKRQAQRWAEMTPEERTDYINNIRTGLEPLKYAMIDAWNHSRILIRALAEYMKEQQILRPVDLIYSDAAFKEYQSKIMTEFWAQNKELADDFGKKIKYSHQKVEEAIKEGTFENLKKEIEREREERINILAKEYQAEAEEAKKIEEEKIQAKEALIPQEKLLNRKEFAEIYKNYIDKYNLIPDAYIKETAELIFERLPEDMRTKYTNALKNNEPIPQNILDELKKVSSREERLNRTLEAAIATEMASKGYGAAAFELDYNSLLTLLTNKFLNDTSTKESVDIKRIERLFNEYNRDMDENELDLIANRYFTPVDQYKCLTREQNDEFEEYLNTYGKSLRILFSDKSAFSNEAKMHFNNKFIKLMPTKIKEYVHPFIQTPEDFAEEKEIGKMKTNIYKRFKYIPEDILAIYTRELAYAIRMDRKLHEQKWLQSFTNIFSTKVLNDKGQIFPNIVKRLIPIEEQLKFIAMEQAMADEFYRVTKNNDAYSRNFEELLNYFDMLSIMKKGETLNITDENGSLLFLIKEKPNTKHLYTRYLKYLNTIKAKKDAIISDNTIVMPELLKCLNPDIKISSKNSYIEKRIKPYVMTDEDYDARREIQKNNKYKKDFLQLYQMRSKNELPPSYVHDVGIIIADTFPKDFIEKFTLSLSKDEIIPDKILKTLEDENYKNNNPQLARAQRALEAAIASELVVKGGNPSFFDMTYDTIMPIYEEKAKSAHYNKLDVDSVHSLYNDYKQDLSKEELENIADHYFVSLDSDYTHREENEKMLIDYINEYGKSVLILFDSKNNLPSKIKEAFNNKFLRLMPDKLKQIAKPLIATSDDIEEINDLNLIRNQIARRFDFIPKKALDAYTQEVVTTIRVYKQPEAPQKYKEAYTLANVKNEICKKLVDEDGGISILRIPKDTLSQSSKLQFLAAEQAMADELNRVSGSDIVYQYELEDLATWYEMLDALRKRNEKMEISSCDGESFVVKQKPNITNIAIKFKQYMEEFATRDDLYLENGEIDKETILYCLNPEENMPKKDERIKNRINLYFPD